MVYVQQAICQTALGDATQTCAALCEGTVALRRFDVPDLANEDPLPLALIEPLGSLGEARWMAHLQALAEELPDHPWGTERYPIFLTSSNYGIDGLYGYSREHALRGIKREESRDKKTVAGSRGEPSWGIKREEIRDKRTVTRSRGEPSPTGGGNSYLRAATPHAIARRLRACLGWGPQITVLSHACVTGQLGMVLAERMLEAGRAEAALVFSFDFLSPFVIGGFNSLKILNGVMPRPYHSGDTGAIGLGEGAAAVVLSKAASPFKIQQQALYNEMHHFTSNAPDGSGFARVLADCLPQGAPPKVWVKGHGTGTLEAGALEAAAVAAQLPESPLLSWKGSIGHTLGSCAVVELAISLAAMQRGQAPGNVGGAAPYCSDSIQAQPFATAPYQGALLLANAFGGAHAALWISHE